MAGRGSTEQELGPYGGCITTTLGGVHVRKFDGPMDENGNSKYSDYKGATREKTLEKAMSGKGGRG